MWPKISIYLWPSYSKVSAVSPVMLQHSVQVTPTTQTSRLHMKEWVTVVLNVANVPAVAAPQLRSSYLSHTITAAM